MEDDETKDPITVVDAPETDDSDSHTVSFQDFQFEMGKPKFALANALRVYLGIRKQDAATTEKTRAEWQAALDELTSGKKG